MGSCTSSDDTKSQNGSNNNNKVATDKDNTKNNNKNNNTQQQPTSGDGDLTRKSTGRLGGNGAQQQNGTSNTNNNTNNNNINGQQQQTAILPPQKRKVDFFLESVVPSYCEFVRARCQFQQAAEDAKNQQQQQQQKQQSQEQVDRQVSPTTIVKPQIIDFAATTSFSINNKVRHQKLLKIFLKTVANFAHSYQRTSLDEARRVVFTLHSDFAANGMSDETTQIEERCIDEGLYRCLEAWSQHNSSHHPFVDADAVSHMTKELENISPSLFDTFVKTCPTKITFGDLCFMYYESACLPTTLAVFEKVQRDATALTTAILQSQQQQGNHNSNNHNNSNNNNNNNNNGSETASVDEFNTNTTANHSRRTSGGTPPPPGHAPHGSTSPISSSSIDVAMVQLLLTDGRQKETQTNSFGIVDHSTAKDFLYRHFGGTIVEENFCTFIQSHKSNSIFDSRSVSSVWQDMTQPLPNYLISSQSIQSEKELNRALLDDVRSFLIKLDFVASTTTVQVQNDDGSISTVERPVETIVVGDAKKSDLTFQKFCEAVRDRGFKRNSFPIIICFPPWQNTAQNLTREREERVAMILNETLGPMLAKGLMFRGATIRDPEFSPATLRHKVLLMSSQARLNPFIGLFVADMARTGLGVRVTDVKEQSPAASAGVTKDDWITRIDSNAIEDKQHLRKCLAGLRIGEEFTVTRENLSHARVVVGAAVDKNDPEHASDLSNILFFNFSGNQQQQQQQQQQAIPLSATTKTASTHHAPASVFESPNSSSINGNIKALNLEKEDSGPGNKTAPPTPTSPEAHPPTSPSSSSSQTGLGNNNNNNTKNNTNDLTPKHQVQSRFAPWETAVVEESDLSSSTRPLDHLALVHLNSSPSFEEVPSNEDNTSNNDNNTTSTTSQQQQQQSPSKNARKQQSEESLMSVQQFGAQLIDSHGSRAASQWSRGTFVVNGHCGYVLRDSLMNMTDGAASATSSNTSNNGVTNAGTSNFTTEWTFKLISLPQEFANVAVLRVEATVFGSAQKSVEATEIKDLVLDEDDDEQQQLSTNNNNNNNTQDQQQQNGSPGDSSLASSQNHNGSPVAASPITATLLSLGRRRTTAPNGGLNPYPSSSNLTAALTTTSAAPTPSLLLSQSPTSKGNFYYTLSTTSFAKFNLSVWKAKIKANRQSRIALTVDFEDGRRIEAVLPAHLLRTGPRAVPFRVVDDEEKKFPQGASVDVLCSVQRKELISPVATSAALS